MLPEVIQVVAEVLVESEGGAPAEQRVAAAIAAIRPALTQGKEEIASRTAAWRVNRALAAQKVSVATMRDGSAIVNAIDATAYQQIALAELDAVLSGDLDLSSLQRLPIKNTTVPASIAGALGCNYDRLKKIVFRQMDLDNEKGKVAKAAMMAKIPQFVASSTPAA